jgi:ubiquinone/menaquinone biosynthesis C-methylase UbiE
MTTDQNIWESLYRQGSQVNIVPYTDVFTSLLSALKGQIGGKKLFEIGCGTGNNLLFARWALGVEVAGCDHSATAIEVAKSVFEKFNLDYIDLKVEGVEKLSFEDESFDIVVDRAALQCNPAKSLPGIVKEMSRILKTGGLLYASWHSDRDKSFGKGEYRGSGDFFNPEDLGTRHFLHRNEALELFTDFETLLWEEVSREDVREHKITSSIYQLLLKKN